jgi:superfamily II DNA/RNA helicase
MHGNLRQSKRQRTLIAFRSGKIRILISTELAARGLDVPSIQHVINYHLPQVPEDFIHRIGRTARAGAEGCALTFITPNDKQMWNGIQRLINPNVKQVFNTFKKLTIEEKKYFQDLNNAEIMKANVLKKITLNALITMNIEEKRNLGLKSTVGGVEIETFN